MEKEWPNLPEREENRVAFIAALIMERCKREGDEMADTGGARFNPYQAQRLAACLAYHADIIKRLCEAECNGELQPHQERRLAKHQADFTEIAEFMGFEARTGGDPRGACAYLINPENRREGDGWGEGWAVYS